MLRIIYRKIRAGLLHYIIPESRKNIFENGKDGVEVIGFFHSASGIGESARLCARQLESTGCKVLCTSVEKMFLKPPEVEWDFKNTATADEIGCRIIHLNPPMIPPVAIRMGLAKYASKFNIGYWAWELEKIPAEWVRAIRYTNAVFCPSEFTSNTIRKYTNKPVMTVPHPVTVAPANDGIRQQLGLSESDFVISSIFSFGSALERKNPYAAVKSFLSAFEGIDNAYLVFKSNHGGNSPDRLKFLETIKPHKNIILIDKIWDREDVIGLIKTSNVYLSLHRSEGFGLTIAEAMLVGTPTVVTNWSGNTDFCHADNSFPIDYKMVPVESDHPEFLSMGNIQWADADPVQTAGILKSIYQDQSEAKARADLCLNKTNNYFKEPIYLKSLQLLKQRTP